MQRDRAAGKPQGLFLVQVSPKAEGSLLLSDKPTGPAQLGPKARHNKVQDSPRPTVH